MYLALTNSYGKTGYQLRESYRDGALFLSRTLLHLEAHPSSLIRYISGGSFYVETELSDKLLDLGVSVSPEDLEQVFWPYVKPEVRRRYEGARSRSRSTSKKIDPATIHIFDRRRAHFLRFGQMDQSGLYRVSGSLYKSLCEKSRDELEQYFMREEMILSPQEQKSYVYVIFDLQKHFYKSYARTMPQGLDQDEVDEKFINDICRLNSDHMFWGGMEPGLSLHDYLKRYAVMFFDFDYAESRYLEDILQDWINRHRSFRFPVKKRADTLKRASSLFGVPESALRKMSKHKLSRLYRRKARELHPDAGGDQKSFVELSEIYQELRSLAKKQ